VEDITYTYLVVRMWNERRLIVPLRHFILTPFENLTKKDRSLVRTVVLHADYRIPIERVREEFEDFVHNHDDWDGSMEPKLLCVGSGIHTMELQGYVSAGDPSGSWYLHCEVREHMLNWLRELEAGLFLPRERVQLVENAEEQEDGEPGADAEQAARDPEDPSGASPRRSRDGDHQRSQQQRSHRGRDPRVPGDSDEGSDGRESDGAEGD
jgi:hypothetical protein